MPLGLPDYIKCNNANEPIIKLDENQVKGMGIFADTAARNNLSINLRVEGYVAVVKDIDKTYIFDSTDMSNWGDTSYWRLQSDSTYVHNQSVAASSWVITHNLNKYANVTVLTGGVPVEGYGLVYDSLNQLTLSFTSAGSATNIDGVAYVN